MGIQSNKYISIDGAVVYDGILCIVECIKCKSIYIYFSYAMYYTLLKSYKRCYKRYDDILIKYRRYERTRKHNKQKGKRKIKNDKRRNNRKT